AEPWHSVGEVHLVRGLELLLLKLVHDSERHPSHLLGRKTLTVLERNQSPVYPEHRGKAGLQVNVGRCASKRNLQDFVELHASPEATTPLAHGGPLDFSGRAIAWRTGTPAVPPAGPPPFAPPPGHRG